MHGVPTKEKKRIALAKKKEILNKRSKVEKMANHSLNMFI